MRVMPVFSHLEPGSWGAVNLPRYFDRLAAGASGAHSVVHEATRADVFLFLQNQEPLRCSFYRTIREHPLMREAPARCFTWDLADQPCPILPGLYAALPRSTTSRRTEAYCYLQVPNPQLEQVHTAERGRERDIAFSFVGAVCNPLRRRLLSLDGAPGAQIVDTTARTPWHAALGADTEYARRLARSRFVLCPRGLGTSSYRLFEAMQMGSVPVIIADDWVPPAGPEWSRFSIRVAERDAESIPRILRDADGEEMGTRAREAWESWFAPGVQLRRVAELIERIAARTPAAKLGVPSTWPLMAARYRAWMGARQLGSRALAPVRLARRLL